MSFYIKNLLILRLVGSAQAQGEKSIESCRLVAPAARGATHGARRGNLRLSIRPKEKLESVYVGAALALLRGTAAARGAGTNGLSRKVSFSCNWDVFVEKLMPYEL